MINKFKSYISTHTLILCLIILITGLSAGIFFAGIVPNQERVHLITLLQNATSHMLPAILVNLTALLMIGLAGFSVYGFPLALILLWFRSFSVGLCDCLLLYSIGSDDIAGFIFSFLLPQLMLCTVYLLAAAACTGYSLFYMQSKTHR